MAFMSKAQATLSLIGLFGLVFTVIYARNAWKEAQRATANAREQFDLERRAWVSVKATATRQPHPVGGYVFPGEERAPKSTRVRFGDVIPDREWPGGFFWAWGFVQYRLEKDGPSHFTPFAVSVVYWHAEEGAPHKWAMASEMHAINLAPD